jgi:hypothetical protein
MESHFTVCFSEKKDFGQKFDLRYYDQLGNQSEEYKITVDTGGDEGSDKDQDDDLTPPLEDCLSTKWPGSQFDWNGSDPLL